MTSFMNTIAVLAAFVVMSAAHPVAQYAVLKEQPAEVLFKADNYSTVLLECAFENGEKDVKYSWHKNGAPFDWEAAGHVGQRRDEGSIMFFNPKPSDEGVYQCFAQTASGTASTRLISLKRAFINQPKYETKEHKPIFGKPYKLDCVIPESYPKPTIVWETQLRSDPSVSEPVFNRRLIVSPDGNLWFSNVTDEDVSPSFKYVCLARTPAVKDDVVLAEHFIKDLIKEDKPNNGELIPQYVSNDMVAKAGDITMIYCIFGGTPLAFPDWFKDGKNVNGKPGDRVTHRNRSSGKRLLIKDTNLDDQGTYTCDVHNEVGTPQNHSMVLTVVSAPKLTNKPEKHINGDAGKDITVTCHITGKPEPKVTWTYNAKPIENPSVKDGVLTIKQAKKTDTGYYGCNAVNEHGDLYTETLVSVD